MKTRIFSLLSLIVSMAVLAPIGTPSIVAEIERPLPQALADVLQSATQALTAFDCSTVTEIPKSQCEALVAFYNATDGDNWTDNTGWLETTIPCSWYGINCEAGHVSELRMFDASGVSNNLKGVIPPEIGNLTTLKELSLYNNQLSGSIPPEIGNLTALMGLALGMNRLSGSIPSEIGNLTMLTGLNLSGNQLSGPIPPEIGNLTALMGLGLGINQLSGSIPPEIGNLTMLTWLGLSGNQLSGPIPPEIGNLTALKELWLHANQLSGSIPPEIGNLTALRELYLYNNQLSGPIPSEIGNLTALMTLYLYNNQLSGPIPPEIGNLAAVWGLNLSSNQLSGPIPPEIGNLSAGRLLFLSLHNNQLSGPIPPEIGNITALSQLDLSSNQLSGPIPPEIGNLTALSRLDLSSNQLSGEMPAALTQVTYLHRFHFYNTFLCVPASGPVPEWLSGIRDVVGTGLICNGMVIDIGFRPDPDGYRFDNWTGLFPVSPTPLDPDFRKEDLAQMFGEEAVCWKDIGPGCILRYAAVQWQWQANEAMNPGHCDGMTVTSLRFFKGLDTPKDFQSDAQSTYDLHFTNVRHHIAYYFARQIANPVAQVRVQTVFSDTVQQILDKLYLSMSGGALDPTTLLVYDSNWKAGHSVTPYAIEDRGDGEYRVWVYDNNHKNDANRYVTINTTSDSWSYDLGWTTWSGGGDTLGAIPISTYDQQPQCPWCGGGGGWLNSTSLTTTQLQTSLSGLGNLLITDSQGRRIGLVGDQFVNEIPGAFGSSLPGGLGIPTDPTYHLPLTETYSILLDGQALTQKGTTAVTQFGPGYAAWFENITVGPTTQDHLIIAPDGRQLAYAPNEVREVTLSFALDDITASRKLQIHGADIGGGQVVTLTADVVQGDLVFDKSQAGDGQYDIKIYQNDNSGEHRFIHADIVISATDTHYIGYGAWDGAGSIILEVDHGSDGVIDETIELDNQVRRVYLPLVLRQSLDTVYSR